MSQHHRKSKHTTAAPSLRAQLQRALPLPCVECGNAVLPGQAFHLAHIVAAMDGGRTTPQNTGVAHPRCNLKSGGKRGAALVNKRKRTEGQAAKGRRAW